MKLVVERTWCGSKCTIGFLTVNGINECFTLEDVQRGTDPETVKDWKVHGETAIPKGIYPLIVTYSNRFKRELPLLVDVPGFTGVRIHPGNTAADTEGCILVGKYKGPDSVSDSRAAFNALFAKIEAALAEGDDITIEVR